MFKRFTRKATADREAAEVHVAKRIGRTQYLTPEGFLYCEAVPIKRTGTMMYGPGEVPVKPGKDGLSYVTRDAAALFSDAAINSYQGKAVVNDHPPEDVTPANWARYAKGTVLNPRRGEGDDSDVMVADLLITDAATIKDVLAGKREVSAGYEADYEDLGGGAGRQNNIIGNHVALVARGRCGPRCAIGDSDHNPSTLKGTDTMATKNARPRVKLTADLIRTAFKDAGDNLAEQLAGEVAPGDDGGTDEDGATHIHIHAGGAGGAPGAAAGNDDDEGEEQDPIEARFQALEAGHQEILSQIAALTQAIKGGGGEAVPSTDESTAPGADGPGDPTGLNADADADDLLDGKGDTKPDMTKDSAALANSWQSVIADAEVLVPGFRVPTFDAALPRAKTVDNLCALRRGVLDHVMMTAEGASLLRSANSGADVMLAGMKCPAVAALFKVAAATKRTINNRALVGDGKAGAPLAPVATILSPADINKANAAFWAGR